MRSSVLPTARQALWRALLQARRRRYPHAAAIVEWLVLAASGLVLLAALLAGATLVSLPARTLLTVMSAMCISGIAVIAAVTAIHFDTRSTRPAIGIGCGEVRP